MHATTRTDSDAQRLPARARSALRAGAGTLWIWGVFGLCAIAPVLTVFAAAVRGFSRNSEAALDALTAVPPGALVASAAYAGAIALLALGLAWPVAVVASGARRRWLLALATPMLLPPYLAHAGWSILRAPTTPLGRWIGGAPEHGLDWLPLAVNRAVAVWGLALWAWPLAALVIAIGLRSLGPDMTAALRLERCSPMRRWLTLARAAWPSIAAAFILVMLLMLGSAVPLHIARVETAAIRIWMLLDEHPAEPWLAWIAAWPLVAVAIVAGALLSGPLARLGRTLGALATDDEPSPRASWPARALASAPWILATVVPLALFLWSLGSARPLLRFVRDAREGILSAGAIAGCVGALSATLALGASHAAARARGRPSSLRPLLALALAAALTPGILIGSAVAQAPRLPVIPPALGASVLPVVLAHTARFAFLPLLVGAWIGTTEAASLAQLRALDGAAGLGGWLRTALPAQWAPTLAASLGAACLSFHEIEASIQVQPPGLDHLAQRLLQWLHYERLTELSAASAFLLALGIAASAAIVLGAGRPRTLRTIHR